MSTKYKFLDPEGIYFVSFATVGWVDVFTKIEIKRIFVESLRYCINNKGFILHASCLMTNYVHLIYSSKESGMHPANLRGIGIKIEEFNRSSEFILRTNVKQRIKLYNINNHFLIICCLLLGYCKSNNSL